MWVKEKMSKSFSTGILILIFLLLFIQFVFFVLKAVDRYGSDGVAEVVSDAVADSVVVGDSVSAEKSVGDSLVPRRKRGDNMRVIKDGKGRSGVGKKVVLHSERKYHSYPIEINRADTGDFNSLYGIGAYYAEKIVEYREQLGGSFVAPEQLMEVWGIDSARFNGFSDRLFVDTATVIRLDLYALEMDSLARHPYIGSYAARGIERYRKMVSREDFSVDKLVEYNIIGVDRGEMLKLYFW